jgi:hypothetical protein
MPQFKLFMLLLGCKPPGRHTEQHDVFFGIAPSLDKLAAEIKAFWPGPERIHIDAWREVNYVDGFSVHISEKAGEDIANGDQVQKLFFINLGGYQENKFEEQHYFVLTAKPDRSTAFREAKETTFFKENHCPGGSSHIDDKYGIDVDDLYQIEDILSPGQKEKYRIELHRAEQAATDPVHLGYLKMVELEKGNY